MILERDTGLMIDSENTLGEDRLTAARRVSVIPHLVNTIVIGMRLRAVDQENIDNLAASMATIGLRTPITVVVGGEDVRLVSGLHRLEAAKKLGWTSIDAFEVMVETDDTTIRLWEISENLHRVDLTVQERAEHVAEWVRLTGDKQGRKLRPLVASSPTARG
jgi:ParB/RepB/Spo0J family partition protein